MDDYIFVRGLPITRTEIFFKQEQLSAQLFDESMFDTEAKRTACANVIYMLDKALKRWLVRQGLTSIPENDIVSIDIGDSNWNYIPVQLVSPDSILTMMPTKDAPAGKVAWFRYHKYHKGLGHTHAHTLKH